MEWTSLLSEYRFLGETASGAMLPSKNDVLSSIDRHSAIRLAIIKCIILEPIFPITLQKFHINDLKKNRRI